MREILFRGKRVDNGEWVEGFVCQDTIVGSNECCVKYVIHTPTNTPFDDKWYEIEQNSISEFTGLTDKNATKIFEGDIVILKGDEEEPLEVAFDECCFQIYGGGVCYCMDNFYDHDLEVIGNIYDNPELLNSSEKPKECEHDNT